MGRLIDADRLKEVFSRNVVGGNAYFDLIDNAPTVEAIPKADIQKALKEGSKDISKNVLAIVREEYISKADYENRLKADMVAMLTELQLEIEECVDGGEGSPQFEQGVDIARCQVVDIVQKKINALRGNENE